MTNRKQNKNDSLAEDIPVEEYRFNDVSEQVSSEEQQLHNAFAPQQQSLLLRLRNRFLGWWHNKPARYSTLGGLVVVVAIILAIPVTRYGSLNVVGVRGSVQLTVTDSSTKLPLQNVQVRIGDTMQKTAQNGTVTLSGIKLGSQKVVVHKNAFASQTSQITVTPGKTELPGMSLQAVGAQYSFKVLDYVTGKPVPKATVTSGGEASANVNESGEAVLTLTATGEMFIPITIAAESYISQETTIEPGKTTPDTILLVVSQKNVFASNQSGVLGIFSVDIDGKNRKELFSPVDTGGQQSVQLRSSNSGKWAALVSKKDTLKNKEGYVLDALTLLDVASATNKTIERGEEIQIIDWTGNNVVYSVAVSGVSAANPQRSKLFSYNASTDKRTQLAAANYFSGALVVDGAVYYAVSSTDPNQASVFMQIATDGKNRQLLSKDPVWSLYRTSYTDISLQNEAGWRTYNTKIYQMKSNSPPNYVQYRFDTSPDESRFAYVEQRDGKGVIIISHTQVKKETVLTVEPSADSVRWLTNDILVYRTSGERGAANYVVSANGITDAAPVKKITDVFRSY